MAYMRDAAGRRLDSMVIPSKLRALYRPLASLPAVMASPPTVGTAVDVTSNATTTTTGSVLTNPIAVPYYVGGVADNGENANAFRSYGWSRVAAGSGPALAMGRAIAPHGLGGGGYPSSVEFTHDGASFELRLYTFTGAGVSFQLYVDDQPMSASTVTVASTGIVGHSFLVPITFGGIALRRIRVEFDRFQAFGGIVTNGADFTTAGPAATAKPQLLLVGDSYSDGAVGVGPLDTYAMQLGKLLGMDTWVDGQGGTGFVATSGAGKSNYINRIVPNAGESRLKPDVIILQTSTNDGASAPLAAEVATRIPEAIAACRSQWPTAKILMPGLMLMLQPSVLPSTNVLNNANARTAATATPPIGADLFVDAFPGLTAAGQNLSGWYTGSGNVDTPGTGNSGRYRSADNIHGTAAWHAMAARALAGRFGGYLAAA